MIYIVTHWKHNKRQEDKFLSLEEAQTYKDKLQTQSDKLDRMSYVPIIIHFTLDGNVKPPRKFEV